MINKAHLHLYLLLVVLLLASSCTRTSIPSISKEAGIEVAQVLPNASLGKEVKIETHTADNTLAKPDYPTSKNVDSVQSLPNKQKRVNSRTKRFDQLAQKRGRYGYQASRKGQLGKPRQERSLQKGNPERKSRTAFILALISIALIALMPLILWGVFATIFFSIPALILSVKALRNKTEKRKMAIAALVLSIIATLFILLFILLMAILLPGSRDFEG